MLGVHDFTTGVHGVQKNKAERPMAIFMVIMITHRTLFIHPSVRRNSVTAKAVLVQAMAVTVKVARTATTRTNASRFGG